MAEHFPERPDGQRVASTVYMAQRRPAAYRSIECRCEGFPSEWHKLTFVPDRGYIEPRTNLKAEPVLGPVLEWCYTYPERRDW